MKLKASNKIRNKKGFKLLTMMHAFCITSLQISKISQTFYDKTRRYVLPLNTQYFEDWTKVKHSPVYL